MGSTNNTPNLNLPQFVDSDKPSWLGDFNHAMNLVDHFAEETNDMLTAYSGTVDDAKAAAQAAIDAVKDKVRMEDLTTAIKPLATKTEVTSAIQQATVGVDKRTYEQRLSTPYRNAVFIGSSNSMSSGWPPRICSKFGWTERNFAYNGGAYTQRDNSFYEQAQRAAASSEFANDDVAVVFVTDASNDIRAMVDVGSRADDLFPFLKRNFPHARIIALPVIWPSTPMDFAPPGTGGYNEKWHEWLHKNVNTISRSVRANGCEFIDQSWTWLTGRDQLMVPNEVHPNSAGHDEIARFVELYLRGSSTRYDSTWTTPSLNNALASSPDSGRPLATRRDGWTVFIEGSIKARTSWQINGAGVGTDIGFLPRGDRPTFAVALWGTEGNGKQALAYLFPNGTIRVQSNVEANQHVAFSGTYIVG